jgi:hypothetical protein
LLRSGSCFRYFLPELPGALDKHFVLALVDRFVIDQVAADSDSAASRSEEIANRFKIHAARWHKFNVGKRTLQRFDVLGSP